MEDFFSKEEEALCVSQGLAPPSLLHPFTLSSSSKESEGPTALHGEPMLMLATAGVGVSLVEVCFRGSFMIIFVEYVMVYTTGVCITEESTHTHMSRTQSQAQLHALCLLTK